MLLKIEDLWEKSLGKIFDFSSNKSLGFNTSIIDGKFSSPKTFFPFFFCLFLHPEGITQADDVDGQMLIVSEEYFSLSTLRKLLSCMWIAISSGREKIKVNFGR